MVNLQSSETREWRGNRPSGGEHVRGGQALRARMPSASSHRARFRRMSESMPCTGRVCCLRPLAARPCNPPLVRFSCVRLNTLHRSGRPAPERAPPPAFDFPAGAQTRTPPPLPPPPPPPSTRPETHPADPPPPPYPYPLLLSE